MPEEEKQVPTPGGFEKLVKAAATQAVEAAEEQEPEAPEAEETPPAPEVTRTADDQPEAGEEETPEAPEAQELPDKYFELDLSELEPDQREEFFTALKARDDEIQRLQRRNATEPKPDERSPQPEPQPEPEAVSDDDLMRAAGYNPDDATYDIQKEIALPFLKRQLEFEKQLQQVSQFTEGQAALAEWNGQLDVMEQTYGELPISREDLLDYAIDEEIATAQDAYLRYTAPLRLVAHDEVDKLRQQATEALRAKKQQATSTRPSSSPDAAQSEIRTGNLAETVKKAAEEAEKKLGYTWEQALQDAGAG